MSGAVYCGDDIGALVFDVGSNSTRAGYAGEDTPRLDIPSFVGVLPHLDNGKKGKYAIGVVALHCQRPDMEVVSFVRDGGVDNMDMFESVLEHVYGRAGLQVTPEDHPVLLTEQAWAVQAKREAITELMFEKHRVPALYLAKSPALVAFANGRSTCLVVDSGSSQTSAVPVHDGHIITQAIVKSPAGGDYLSAQCRQLLADGLDVELVPAGLIGTKEAVRLDEQPSYKLRRNAAGPIQLSKSHRNYLNRELVQDFQSLVLHVSDSQLDEDAAANIPTVHYEFPTGFNRDFGTERFKVGEPLFNLAARSGCGIQPTLDVSSAVTTSVGMCDADLRPVMYNNVIVTGGNSNLQGFTDRLTRDIQTKVPQSMRLKVHAQQGNSEKRYAAWLGGSIFGSLGSFQHLWISKQEYEEAGKVIVRSRC